MDGEACKATPGCTGVIEDGYCSVCGRIGAASTGHSAVGVAPAGTRANGSTTANGGPQAAPPAGRDGSGAHEWGSGLGLMFPQSAAGTETGPSATSATSATSGTSATSETADTSATYGTTGTADTSAGTSGSSGSTGSVSSRPSGPPSSPSRRTTFTSRGTASRSRIGAGLVSVPPMPMLDPSTAVMAEPVVAEDKRFCSKCGTEVGRSKDDRPGRLSGFCSKCRQPYSFVPPLDKGDLVAGQYRIWGCLAYGGLGWIYLAQDEQVSNRWVVLKGLLNRGDSDAMEAALAERQFLARVEHPSVVRIYNFVQHAGAGYIVMEYVGGKTLKRILQERRQSAGAAAGALAVEHAVAYILTILPAFSYFHRLNLVYNDFKPDNVMLHGDDVKLIDLGAVTRMDDTQAAVYGTDGYQAPEVARLGPSASSDLYSVARCLAVLILDFRGYQTKYKYSLPEPEDHPILKQHESLYRFLVKGCATNPDDRFQSADEMADQLLGVLREVVSVKDGSARPAASSLFGGDLQALYTNSRTGAVTPDWRHLPTLKVNPADPSANFVVNVSAVGSPAEQMALLEDSIRQGHVTDSAETRLAAARALIWMGRTSEAEERLEHVNRDDPWDWRVTWYRGLSLLRRGMAGDAKQAFERITLDLPGELAPKLAEALAAEQAGDLKRAVTLYEIVATTDPNFTSACFGLARVKAGLGDLAGAVAAYRRLPETSSLYVAAQVALARTLIRWAKTGQSAGELVQASSVIQRLDLDNEQRSQLTVELLEAALSLITSRSVKPEPTQKLVGCPFDDGGIRLGLERAYRDLARLANGEEKIRLVDRANEVRPLTAV
jgi:serine/threonine-protein kinase PknG